MPGARWMPLLWGSRPNHRGAASRLHRGVGGALDEGMESNRLKSNHATDLANRNLRVNSQARIVG